MDQLNIQFPGNPILYFTIPIIVKIVCRQYTNTYDPITTENLLTVHKYLKLAVLV